jgi:DNA-binding response OmpR family regulator
MNVLVIEDDSRIANLVECALTEDGHRVAVSHNGREGAHLLLSGKFDAALLDILLPEMDGFEVLEEVRTKHCKTPILVLTAVDAVPKILQAFDMGADDYLVKPFILEILLARVGAIARRVTTIELLRRALEVSPSTETVVWLSVLVRRLPSRGSSLNCSKLWLDVRV